MNNKISLVVNSRNEADDLDKCLFSAKKYVDEIIIVNMGGDKLTEKIAKKYGAKIYSHEPLDIVEPARNFGINKVTKEWVLILDPDEQLSESVGFQINDIAYQNKFDLVEIPFKNIIFGKWIKHAWWWPDYHIRLFRKTCISWSNEVHTPPRWKGKKLRLPAKVENAIIHNNYKNVFQFIEKMNRYTNYEKNFDLLKIKSSRDLFHYFEFEFAHRYFYQKGFKDGMHGFVLAKFMEFYRFLEMVKYWEKHQYTDIISPKKIYDVSIKKYSDYYQPEKKEINDPDMRLKKEGRKKYNLTSLFKLLYFSGK